MTACAESFGYYLKSRLTFLINKTDSTWNSMSYIQVREDSKLEIPDDLTIGFIEGDGIGPDISRAAVTVINSCIELAYKEKRRIGWKKILAGDAAFEKTGKHLPQESLDELKKCVVSIKGPLTTPIGE